MKLLRKVFLTQFNRQQQQQNERPKMKVMLAKTYDPSKHNVNGWMVSEKLDGMRAIWDGEKLLTRTGKTIHAPNWFTHALPSDLTLDGELWMGRGQFQKVVSVCRKHEPVDSEWEQVKFMVFDIPFGLIRLGLKHTFEERYEYLATRFVPPIEGSQRVVFLVEHTRIKTAAEIPARLKAMEEQGGEGLMLRAPWSEWEPKRSAMLLKVKSFKDADATVIGHAEGAGKHAGRLGALVCKLDDGKEFKIGTGFTDEQREQPPAIGERVIFSFFELSSYGVPRFPAYIGVRGD
jgi:DNA ligase-1